MADVTGTITTIDAILKDNQTAKNVTKQFIRSSGLYDKLSKNMGGFWGDTQAGRRYIQPIETEPMQAYTRFVSTPSGGGTYSPATSIPTSRGPSGEKQRLQAIYNPLSYINASVKFDLNVLARADGTGPSQAFVNDVTDRIAGVSEAISAEVGRQIFMATGDGTLGDAAALIAIGTTGNVTSNAAFIEKILKRNILSIGSKVELWPATAGVPTTGIQDYVGGTAGDTTTLVVSAIDRTAGTITLQTVAGGTPTTTARTSGLVAMGFLGNRTWNGTANTTTEITSLPMITQSAGTTAIGGLTVTNSDRWRGNSFAQGGVFTVSGYMSALELVDAAGGVGENTYSFADRKRFNSALLALTTNLVGVAQASATATSMAYGSTSEVEAKFRKEVPLQDGTTLVQERQCAPGIIYSLDVDHLQLLDIDGEKIRWIAATGGTSGTPNSGSVLLWDGNFAYTGSAYFNGDLVTDKRNAHVAMTGVT